MVTWMIWPSCCVEQHGQAVEQGLNQDLGILAAYLRKWRLQLSTGKTVSAAYHLCNREAKRELSVSVDNKRLEHQLARKYLGVSAGQDTVLQTAP
ncbi:hypothetical protein NHX12_026780 [Muraenolepis orangiensis]|uniref:Uncharacterized protein n=1 Tax=Muraenolepis orangiensis TaxID=630683 RepID=A0A9Q0EJ80_9TELE|nr:hypothetical protein NHX12_026780 [Muraenolepis orangiensis]